MLPVSVKPFRAGLWAALALMLLVGLLAGCGVTWPPGIPEYPAAEQVRLSQAGDSVLLAFETDDPPDAVMQFYIDEAEKNGWSYETHLEEHHLSVYQEAGQRPGVRSGTRFDITVEAAGGVSRVEIRGAPYKEYGETPR
jgi:hypothetical protein